MDDINDKVNNAGATPDGQLSAEEWNQIPSEIQNTIESLDIALDGSDLQQLVKSISGYSTVGDFYTGAGIADAYTALTVNNRIAPDALIDGMAIRLIIPVSNTGASTLNAFSTGVIDIKLTGGVNDPAANELKSGVEYIFTYKTSPSNHWEIKEAINIKPINTISSFTNDDTSVDIAEVLGYHVKGDGYGGMFYWDASQDKANHNGGTIIDPDQTFPTDWTNQTQLSAWFTAGTGAGCWVRSHRESINVRWFGAKGDDTTNDTISIQSAIDYAASLTDRSVSIYFPGTLPGESYKVSGLTYQEGLRYYGDTERRSPLELIASTTADAMFASKQWVAGAASGYHTGTTFEELHLKGSWSNSASAHGIILGGENGKIRNVKLEDFSGIAIYGPDTAKDSTPITVNFVEVKIEDCRISQCSGGISLGDKYTDGTIRTIRGGNVHDKFAVEVNNAAGWNISDVFMGDLPQGGIFLNTGGGYVITGNQFDRVGETGNAYPDASGNSVAGSDKGYSALIACAGMAQSDLTGAYVISGNRGFFTGSNYLAGNTHYGIRITIGLDGYPSMSIANNSLRGSGAGTVAINLGIAFVDFSSHAYGSCSDNSAFGFDEVTYKLYNTNMLYNNNSGRIGLSGAPTGIKYGETLTNTQEDVTISTGQASSNATVLSLSAEGAVADDLFGLEQEGGFDVTKAGSEKYLHRKTGSSGDITIKHAASPSADGQFFNNTGADIILTTDTPLLHYITVSINGFITYVQV